MDQGQKMGNCGCSIQVVIILCLPALRPFEAKEIIMPDLQVIAQDTMLI